MTKPNSQIWNDGHWIRGTDKEPEERAPQLVDQAADWLSYFFSTLRFPGPNSLLPPSTLVVVTFDEADFEAAWTKKEGLAWFYDQIYSLTYQEEQWATSPTPVGFRTGGDLVLAVLGASLYLIYHAQDSQQMKMLSYNTAPFNMLKIPYKGKIYDYMTIYQHLVADRIPGDSFL